MMLTFSLSRTHTHTQVLFLFKNLKLYFVLWSMILLYINKENVLFLIGMGIKHRNEVLYFTASLKYQFTAQSENSPFLYF